MRILRLLVLLLIAIPTVLPAADEWSPQAAPDQVVIEGNARFTILTNRIIRLEWSADGAFEDRASLAFINRHNPGLAFTRAGDAEWLELSTPALKLRYRRASGRFTAENLSISLAVNDTPVTWRPGMAQTGNLGGTYRTLDGYDGGFNRKGEPIDLGLGVCSRDGWVLIDDSASPLFDGTEWPWVLPRPTGERQDFYFFGHGHDYTGALADFTRVAGRIPMPPRFAFGYWWSRYWIYSDAELRRLVQEFERYDVPIDVLVIDMDWHYTHGMHKDAATDHTGEVVGWTGYTWNTNLFPDPKSFLDWTATRGLKIALNLHPASGIAPFEERYAQMCAALGIDPATGEYIQWNLEDRRWAQAYLDIVLAPLRTMGVDFWWLDWQQWRDSRFVAGLSNTWWLNYVFYTEMQRRGERPLLFHRWGGLGNHRYQIGFSGDTRTTWQSLAFQPYFTATASNVGYGYWSHDIGGHMPLNDMRPDGELYLRWLQYGIFSPILRTHSTKSALVERRFWMYPEQFHLMREAVKLRYALVPYIYTAARQAYDTGVSVVRPLYYHHPETPEAYRVKDEYYFGDDLIVAPVTTPVDPQTQLATREVWLPPGIWYEWSSGTMLQGGALLERSFSLAELPVYARAGAIIPMYPEMRNLHEKTGTYILTFFPGDKGKTRIYEDDGVSDAYRHTPPRFVTVETDAGGKVIIEPPAGLTAEEAAQPRTWELHFPTAAPITDAVATVGGKRVDSSLEYRGEDLCAIVRIAPVTRGDQLVIDVGLRRSDTSFADGIRGALARVATVTQMMRYEIARTDWIATLPDELLRLESTPTRIGYWPDTVRGELDQARISLARMATVLGGVVNADREIVARCLRHLGLQP